MAIRYRILAAVILAAAFTIFGSCSRPKDFAGRTLRIGFDNAPPYSLIASDGSPRGLAVELIQEAARRRDIHLQWVKIDNGRFDPDDLLSRKVVDLWPILGRARARIGRVYIARPWIENNFFLISRKSAPVTSPAEANGRRVIHLKAPMAAEMAANFLGASRLIPVRGFTNILGPLCNGSADAAFMEARTLEHLLLDRPADCVGVALKVSSVPNAVSHAGIAAHRDVAAAAEALTDEIVSMAADGRFARAVDKWSSFSATETRSLLALQQSRERDILFYRGLWMLAAACFGLSAVAGLAFRARRMAERARSIEASRVRILRRLAQGDPMNEIADLLRGSLERCCGKGKCDVRLQGGDRDLDSGTANILPVLDSRGVQIAVLAIGTPTPLLTREQRKEIDGIRQLTAIVAEHRMLHNELQIQASRDRLTGLANRFVFAGAMEKLQGTDTGSVFFFDLDRFKQVNDRFGHGTGDIYLAQAAARIRDCFRSSDLVARLGGDEFAAIAVGLKGADAVRACEAVIEAFRSPFIVEGLRIVGGISIGVSSFPQDGLTSTELQRSADAALYDAKKEGRNRYRICSAEIRERAVSAIRAEQLVRQALDQDWLELFYQPQEDAAGRLVGMEALVRIRHPEQGLISPADFIEIAEQAGLVTEIDAWVLPRAMRQFAEWRSAGLNPVRISVNVSRLDLSHTGLFDRVMASLHAFSLEPGAIQIELTETAAASGTEGSTAVLRQLRDAGVSLALDDFGCGYSSLRCLHGLPADTVKIDRSFVRRLDEDTGSRSLIAAVIAAARALRMTVAAEGIETNDQRNSLLKMGCDVLQGYSIGRPVNAAAARLLLADRLCVPIPALELSAV